MTEKELQEIKVRCKLNKIIKADQLYVEDVSALLAEVERLQKIIDNMGESAKNCANCLRGDNK